MSEKIAVIGLGYVGLPLMVGLAQHFDSVVGFDIDSKRVTALREGNDWTGEISKKDLLKKKLILTDVKDAMVDSTLFIVTVPTPIDQAKRPDLTPVIGACNTVGEVLKKRKADAKDSLVPLIVFESTVWPGLTDELCGPKIAEVSGLKAGVDFKLGYSPERINPGDKKNRLETIVKVISADDDASLDRLEFVYGKIIEAGLHRASSIKVAEAAKVIENTQRDINIALMNELALICDRLDICTHDVLEAAGTKWNFLKFSPGLVGGHCIGVDPYYLTARAEELGYHPQVILSGRRINDSMPVFIAQKLLKLLVNRGQVRHGTRVGILGLSFKENVRDLRNSRIPEIVKELEAYGMEVLVHDPVVDPDHAHHEYGLTLRSFDDLKNLDALILAVPHSELMENLSKFWPALQSDGVVIDVKSAIDATKIPQGLRYWSL
ncbi:MAG: nucleotide sugar dehydrogenase [Alphaproteobacteria bacterium]|nr:nucleotide sugar dehydrogenase [Alphaproteobacteria bacterium]